MTRNDRAVRVAVIGGTGLVGRCAVRTLRAMGHEAIVIARSTGIDVTTGEGLKDKLAGVASVIDVTNTSATDAAAAEDFFARATAHLLAAEVRAGVRHHVVLSIVGIDRVEGNAHYAGKRRQEAIVRAGAIPFTIQRACQFHEFAAMVVGWTRKGNEAVVPPLLVQPVAASDVGIVLAELAIAPPRGRAPDLAGPEPQDLVDMARRTMEARGDAVRLVPSWRKGLFGVEMAGEILLPGSDARIATTTFEEWLNQQVAFRGAFRASAARPSAR